MSLLLQAFAIARGYKDVRNCSEVDGLPAVFMATAHFTGAVCHNRNCSVTEFVELGRAHSSTVSKFCQLPDQVDEHFEKKI